MENTKIVFVSVPRHGARNYIPKASRPLDYKYDPIYTLCGWRDNLKAAIMTSRADTKFVIRPFYQTMFSELENHPNKAFGLDPRPKPPQSASGPIHTIIPPQEVDVRGVDRYKFYKRPNPPLLQHPIPQVHFAPFFRSHSESLSTSSGGIAEMAEELKTVCTQGTQTMFRESETQTDPYSPPYAVCTLHTPEVLTIAHFSWGKGLPAGLDEVEMIERARIKREWAKKIPHLHDLKQKEKRNKMLAEMELTEWALREEEIEKILIIQMEVMFQITEKKRQLLSEKLANKLDRSWAVQFHNKEKRLQKIRHEYGRELRRLIRNHQGREPTHRDIVKDYASKSSHVYAPVARLGNDMTDKGTLVRINNEYVNTLGGLKKLEKSPRFLKFDLTVKPCEISTGLRKDVRGNKYVPRKYQELSQLEWLQKEIEKRRSSLGREKEPLKCVEYLRTPTPRPVTPTVDKPDPSEEKSYLAVAFLQKILYGRSVQCSMYAGKERRVELIEQIHTTCNMQKDDQIQRIQDWQEMMNLQERRKKWKHGENQVKEMLDLMEGETVGKLLDFLSKELIRLQDERKIHAFALLAERDRFSREAEESGRRQIEERGRRINDEIFKQVVKVTQTSVDSYLEDIIVEGMKWTAEAEARKHVHQLTRKINEAAYELEKRASQLEKEEMVSELVYGFLLPEAQKKYLRQKLKEHQTLYLQAAHDAVNIMFEEQQKRLGERGGDDDDGQGIRTSEKDPTREQIIESIKSSLLLQVAKVIKKKEGKASSPQLKTSSTMEETEKTKKSSSKQQILEKTKESLLSCVEKIITEKTGENIFAKELMETSYKKRAPSKSLPLQADKLSEEKIPETKSFPILVKKMSAKESDELLSMQKSSLTEEEEESLPVMPPKETEDDAPEEELPIMEEKISESKSITDENKET